MRGKVEGREEEEKCARTSACHRERLETQRKSPTNLLDSLITAADWFMNSPPTSWFALHLACNFWDSAFFSPLSTRLGSNCCHYCGPGQCLEPRDGYDKLESSMSQDILGCMCAGERAGQALLCWGDAMCCTPHPLDPVSQPCRGCQSLAQQRQWPTLQPWSPS